MLYLHCTNQRNSCDIYTSVHGEDERLFFVCLIVLIYTIVYIILPQKHAAIDQSVSQWINESGSFIRSFVLSFIRSLVRSFVLSFVLSFVRSFIRSVNHLNIQSYNHFLTQSNNRLVIQYLVIVQLLNVGFTFKILPTSLWDNQLFDELPNQLLKSYKAFLPWFQDSLVRRDSGYQQFVFWKTVRWTEDVHEKFQNNCSKRCVFQTAWQLSLHVGASCLETFPVPLTSSLVDVWTSFHSGALSAVYTEQ